jgi:hypothetical protein
MKPDGDRENRAYTPGEIVPISGIYTAVHRDHREAHQVVAIRGEEFPPCRLCNNDVRFHVSRVLPHMTHDFDLTGPMPRALRRRAKAAGEDAK